MKFVLSCCRLAVFLLVSTVFLSLLATASISATAPSEDAVENLNNHKMVRVRLIVPAKYRKGVFSKPRYLYVPPGFKISVFAALLKSPRILAVGPDGNLYVSLPDSGKIAVFKDKNHDGVADSARVFASGLVKPHGLAWRGNDLIVAETNRLTLLRDDNHDGRADVRKLITTEIPGGGMHWTRSVVVGPDGMLYTSIGSSCNACVEKDARRGSIVRFSSDGDGSKIYATGLRNSVGMAFHPEKGELWAVDNGRDNLGDDVPPEELNKIIDGGDYGWPHCYGDRTPDPQIGNPWYCKNTIPPVVKMQAHSAPLGITFGYKLGFPKEYRKVLYIAYHGSWDRRVPTGYKLVAVPFDDGRPDGVVTDIVTGWLDGTEVWGRPVDPVVGADGALYLSDDYAGAIYRITYEDRGKHVSAHR